LRSMKAQDLIKHKELYLLNPPGLKSGDSSRAEKAQYHSSHRPKPGDCCEGLNGIVPSDKLICAVSSRGDGNMSLTYGDTKDALNNRRDFLEGLAIDYKDLVCAAQVHGCSVRYVTEKDRGRGALAADTAIADTDALITDIRGLPLAIFTADCLSIFLYDPKRPALGLVHAGWRSTKENIVTETLRSMGKNFDTEAKDLLIGFGPAIRSCCYGVGSDFEDFFPGELIKKDRDYYLDLARINLRQLLESGVIPGNIFDCRICTFCRCEDFFSYRKEGISSGRMMSVAMLK